MHAYTYVPVHRGGCLKSQPYSPLQGSLVARSNWIGAPHLPIQGSGIDWGNLLGLAKQHVVPLVEKHGVNVTAKVLEAGLKRLGLGVDDGDDVFAEAGAAMRRKGSRRRVGGKDWMALRP